MVKISEICDGDGSNGKKAQEDEEKGIEKPKQTQNPAPLGLIYLSNYQELYAFVGFPTEYPPEWGLLHREPIADQVCLQLGSLDSLPPIPHGSAVVTIGAEMYVFGGSEGSRNRTNLVILIDVRPHPHTWREFPNMIRDRYRAAARVIDGKIYVIGGCELLPSDTDWMSRIGFGMSLCVVRTLTLVGLESF